MVSSRFVKYLFAIIEEWNSVFTIQSPPSNIYNKFLKRAILRCLICTVITEFLTIDNVHRADQPPLLCYIF